MAARDEQVETAVDAIWTQWQSSHAGGSEHEVGDGVLLEEETDSVFLTGVPSVSTVSTPEVVESDPGELSRRRSSVFTDSGTSVEGPEEDDNEDDDGLSSFAFPAARLQANVQTPGLKRRKRLTDLHHFVSTQLQKRLFKSWETIEIAFTGSGDMTVSQIVKFLQLSDVQLGDKDAAKVQKILEEHVAVNQAALEMEALGDEPVQHSNQKRGKSRAVLSYEGFRKIFHPVDPQEASRWKREFDREKFRRKQEKEIYGKELAALEEKGKSRLSCSYCQNALLKYVCAILVRQRLANSAKQMIEILQQFKCEPGLIPWENELQRMQLRSQFLEVIFRKPHRRRILQLDHKLPHSDPTETSGTHAVNTIPEKLSVRLILSTLLQKYSRNGHFESIEVPVAAYLYHDIAADIMKQSVRQHWERFKIDQWPERQMIFCFRMKKQIFHDWRAFADRARMLRRYVLRKFVAWKMNSSDRNTHQRVSLHPADHIKSNEPSIRRSLPMSTFESPQNGRASRLDSRNTRGDIRGSALLSTDEADHGVEILRRNHQGGDIHNGSSDTNATASLTRIMETELGKKIKRKSRLYDLCLGLYLKYRERDRSNMVGNVVAYRRFGRILLKYLKTKVRHNKKNRFATDLGAFRVMNTRFWQWMIGTVYKLPPATQNDDIVSTKNEDESEDTGDKVVLHWREDREWRLQGIANNPLRAQKLREDLLSVMENDSVRKETIRGRELLLNKKQLSEDAFLRKETGVTLKIKAAQMQQVQQIMRRRAHRLHDAMDNVYDALLQQQAKQQLKSSFRSLRIVVMMNDCYKLKIKYHAFQTLLKHAVWKWKFQSPCLSHKLQRSRQLMLKYEDYMEEQNMFDESSESVQLAATKFSPANAFRGMFLRWVQFAQSSKARQMMILLTRRKQQIWLMQTVFHALKYRVKAKYTYEQRCAFLPYLWRQSMVDLDTYQCKIIALEQRLPTTSLRAKLIHSRLLMQQTAISSPTLKKLFQDHEKEVRLRLQLEKRLMLVAYSDRAIHNYAERASSLFGTTAGRPFSHDKVPPFGSISEVAVICSKKVDGISIVVKANGHVSFEGTLHGNPFGTREVFSLAKGEKLVTVEGFALQSIYGLRFGTSTGRYSKWFGHCEKGSKFEIHSDFFTKREEIVGFFGHADSASINSLGVVMGHTTIKNPFEGLWVQKDHHSQHNVLQQSPHRSLGDDLPLSDRQFAYFLQVRACEVLLVMERAHAFAVRAYRMEDTLLPALGNMRIIMALARWMLNALSHGLVQRTEREEEGKQIMQIGQEKYAAGEKLLFEGVSTMQIVDSFRDSAGQLDAATLGVKKIVELREMMAQAQQQMAQGERLRYEGQHEIMLSQRILPHLPTSRRMITAIRKMYKVVQTKDEIDQMTPELRSVLLLKKSGASASDSLLAIRGKLRPGKDLIVLSDEKSSEGSSNASMHGEDNESNNASSSWSLEPLNPESEQRVAAKKPRPLSSATYLSRRELGIDALTVESIGKSFAGMSLLERQMEWLRKKHDKMEAERLRQVEESERELTFQPKLIRRITYSGDRYFRDTSVAPASSRSFTRSESSRRVGETAGTLLKERTLPKVPRLSHHRRSKRKTPLQSATISQPVGVSCKLLDSMKSELQASLASNRHTEADLAPAEQSAVIEKQPESDSALDEARSSESSDASGETPQTTEPQLEATSDEDKPPENVPAWSAKPTIGGRRADFDSTETKVRLTLQDASQFELSTMYRKTDRRAGRDGVALHVGRREDTLEEQVIAVLFDREKVTEEEAERWWSNHQHRFAEFIEPQQPREEEPAPVVLPASRAATPGIL
ncbi:unnamed protein product [Phytophthora lilii]|uniref:Unnamed protein product n=1 Tax=Phytophthora lilii TaxID=2077276 RepID=A0A9W6TDQ2_9STRA|nr:unnamed protein product [Phytophthora lilii]